VVLPATGVPTRQPLAPPGPVDLGTKHEFGNTRPDFVYDGWASAQGRIRVEERVMEDATTRPPGDSPSDFAPKFASACSALEAAVFDLLAGGWEEAPRRRAHEMTVALRQAAHDAGCWDAERALRALDSILALAPAEVSPIRRSVDAKLLEFVALVKRSPASRSA
jgi:hypothetical protein